MSDGEPAPILRAQELARRFPDSDAVRQISLRVHAHDYVAIMGPSGCGKSTLLNLLGILDRPTRGRLLFCGQDVWRLSARQRATLRLRSIGFVFQRHHLLPYLSARDNIALPGWRLTGDRRQARQRADELLEQVGLGGRGAVAARLLSVGEAQRVAVARAVVNRPLVVLADEPTGSLDSGAALKVMALLRGLSAIGQTLVLVTHDRAIACQAARQVSMRDGQLWEDSEALISLVGDPA